MSKTCPMLLSTVRAFPREVWVLFFGVFLNKFGGFVIPFLTLYVTQKGFSLAKAGVAVGAYGFGHLFASAVGGQLADTIGRRKTIVLSMFSVAIAMIFLGQVSNFWAITVLTALAGFTGELYRPASSALLIDLVPVEKRVTAFAAYRMAFNAGWAFGPAVGGFLAQHSFKWLFIGDALTSALFGLVALTALPVGVRASREEAGWSVALETMRHDRQFHQVLCSSLVSGFAFFQLFSTFGLHLSRIGFSGIVYGALISMNGFLVCIFELPLSTFTSRFNPRHIIAVGYALVGLGFGVNILANTIPWFIVAMTIITFGEMFAMPVSAAYVSTLAPVSMRGRYNGIYGLTWAIALLLSPSVGMQLLRISSVWLWLACMILGLVAAAIILPEPRRSANSKHPPATNHDLLATAGRDG